MDRLKYMLKILTLVLLWTMCGEHGMFLILLDAKNIAWVWGNLINPSQKTSLKEKQKKNSKQER